MNRGAQLKNFRKMIARATAHAMLLFLPLTGSGQSPLRLQHITVKEGLSQNSVNFIKEDRYGFIWLATGDGLNRYDGREVVIHKSRFTDSASHMLDRNINSRLVEDDKCRIWMAPDAGISYFDYRHAKFRAVLDAKIGTSVILDTLQNKLWTAAPRVGLLSLNTNDLSHTIYPFTDSYQRDSAHVYQINNAVITAKGLWIADAKGLLFFDVKTHKDTRVITRDEVYSACLLRDGSILLTADDGVVIYRPGAKETSFITVKAEGTVKQQWKHCAQDPTTGTVYLGSNTGLVAKLDIATYKYELLSFQSSDINSLFIDRSRNLWVGTEGDGAYKLDIKAEKFGTFSPFNEKSVGNGLMVKSIYQDAKGKIWIGTADKGLWTYDPKIRIRKRIFLPVELKGKQVGSIIKDSTGNIIIAAAGRLFWMDEQTASIKKQVAIPAISASSRELPVIFCVAEWKKNHYLVGTNLGIYSATDEGSKVVARFPLSSKNRNWGGWIYGFSKQADGTIYVGKRNGFSKLRIISDTTLQLLDEGRYPVVIRHFYKYPNDPIVWMASEVGLTAYNEKTKRTQVFDERAGLGNSNIYAILPQNDTTFWISTNKGISSVTVHAEDIENIRIDAANYTSSDGLQSEEFNTGAYYKNENGTLIFGGINGINWFDPKEIRHNPHVARPAISALYINDKLFAADTANYIRSISLPFNKNTISFNLRALEFTQPEENMFAYMLEGLEYDWVYTRDDKARYSNLQPGSYTFLLKARNNEGLWNETPLRLEITIRPPYWQTWWFRLVGIIAFIGIAAIVISYLIRQKVKAKTLQLEKQQALNLERLRISKDVHDDLGAGLSKITLMAEMAQKQVMYDMAVSKDIGHISAVSKDLIDNMRDLIWVLNPENTNLDNLIARMREYCSDYLEGMPLQVRLRFPDEVPAIPISREAQRNIFSTVKEAVHNVVKHAGATTIEVSLTLKDTVLDITITDNGKGISASNAKGHGLSNMANRIKSIGGDCTICPAKDNGTMVAIHVPLQSIRVDSHRKPNAIR